MQRDFVVKGKVTRYPGMAAWHFFSLPKKEAAQIKETFGRVARGWGSIRVAAKVGATRWESSIFPDKKAGTYLLPLKALIRKKEGIEAGDTITVRLSIA
jgi:hypothetical protein